MRETRESSLHLLNYVAIGAVLVTLMTHLAIHGFFGVSNYQQSLMYVDVVGRYRAPISATLLLVLLIAALFHGLYGLRTMLLGVRSGRRWEQAITYGTLAIGVVVAAWGLRTIVFTAFHIGG